MRKIYSFQNTKIKDLIKICQKKNYRNIFLVEGIREFEMAIKGNFSPKRIFICEKIFHKYDMIQSFDSITFFISIKIFKKLAYRDNSGGIIALFQEKKYINQLKNIKVDHSSLILILDGVEKPGNIGAMLRIADAININIIILCNMQTYIYNSNVVRCSLGSVFTRNIFLEKIEYIIYWLQKNKIKIITTGFDNHQKAINMYHAKLFHKIAIVFGSEKKGVSKIWLEKANQIITIPMFGNIDSLNVSNAMSIIVYEIMRQRNYTR